MTLSEQVDALQAKVADLKSSLDASQHETNEQIRARVATAKAKADAARETVHGKGDQRRTRHTPSGSRSRPTRRPRCRRCKNGWSVNATSAM